MNSTLISAESIANSRGSIYVPRAALDLVPVPQETTTYMPVSYRKLVGIVEEHATDILPEYTLQDEWYCLAKCGQRMFGTLTFQNGIPDMGLRIGLRTSYDKRLPHSLVTGAGVFVCSNGMFNGEIIVVRRHTKNSIDDIHRMFAAAIQNAKGDFTDAVASATELREISLDNDDGYRLLGVAAGRDILSPTQFSKSIREWRDPTHDDFAPRNAWSAYNAATEALKSTPPQTSMEKHREWHDLVREQVLGESLFN